MFSVRHSRLRFRKFACVRRSETAAKADGVALRVGGQVHAGRATMCFRLIARGGAAHHGSGFATFDGELAARPFAKARAHADRAVAARTGEEVTRAARVPRGPRRVAIVRRSLAGALPFELRAQARAAFRAKPLGFVASDAEERRLGRIIRVRQAIDLVTAEIDVLNARLAVRDTSGLARLTACAKRARRQRNALERAKSALFGVRAYSGSRRAARCSARRSACCARRSAAARWAERQRQENEQSPRGACDRGEGASHGGTLAGARLPLPPARVRCEYERNARFRPRRSRTALDRRSEARHSGGAVARWVHGRAV